MRFHLGTSKAPTGSSKAAGVQVPTGLKLILRCLLSGLADLLHGSYSSIVVNLCDIDMMAASPVWFTEKYVGEIEFRSV